MADFFLPEIGSFDLVADHLIGRRPGDGMGHALLIGHMDTAFPFGEPERNPFRIVDDQAMGCAIGDMKAGLVVLLYAIKALHATGVTAPRITILYDSDEQAGSLTARKIIEEIVRNDAVSWAFKSEVGLDGGKLRNRRPALGVGLVEVFGIERHVGTGYWDGASAIVALARMATRMQALSERERGIVVNVGQFDGGTRRNLVAGYARAKIDVRARTQSEWNDLATTIQAIVDEESVAGIRAQQMILNHRPAMVPDEKTEQLMATVAAAAVDLSQPVAYIDADAGSDANFPAAMGVPTLDGFGPAGGNTMTRDEFIVCESLAERAALLALTLHRLSIGA
ncbi:MAG: M20/M25/M40 family metallo-hydrolase [Thermomicrobiales bacterium]|nr:M20/M25/M40 family metallo-hydrolase [Thermomicrobiales bacterium]